MIVFTSLRASHSLNPVSPRLSIYIEAKANPVYIELGRTQFRHNSGRAWVRLCSANWLLDSWLPQNVKSIGKCPCFQKVTENLEKFRKMFKNMEVSELSEYFFWDTLDIKHSSNKMVVATKGVPLNTCSPLNSSVLALLLWSGKSQGILLLIFCGNQKSTSSKPGINLCRIFMLISLMSFCLIFVLIRYRYSRERG